MIRGGSLISAKRWRWPGADQPKKFQKQREADLARENAVRFEPLVAQRFERLLEAIGMRALCLRQGLEPIGDFFEAFATSSLRHSRIHIGVFVGFPRDGRLQVVTASADGKIGCRIADHGQIVEMTMRMAGLSFRGRAKDGSNVVLTLDVCLVGEVQIAPIRLRFAGERGFQVFMRLGALQIHIQLLLWFASPTLKTQGGSMAGSTLFQRTTAPMIRPRCIIRQIYCSNTYHSFSISRSSRSARTQARSGIPQKCRCRRDR